MSETEQFLNLVKLMGSTENEVRDKAEQSLIAAAVSNPELFLSVCVQIIENEAVEKKDRMTSIILLKKSLYSASTDESIYRKLNPQRQEEFRRKMLILVAQLNDAGLKSLLADMIGCIASFIYEDEKLPLPAENRWPDLIPHLFELFQAGSNPANSAAVFEILDRLFANSMNLFQNYMQEFPKLFLAAFAQQDVKCKQAALEAFVSFIRSIKRKDLKYIKKMKPCLIAFLNELVTAKDEAELEFAVGNIIDVADCEPGFLKTEFDALLEVLTKIRNLSKDPEDQLKTQVVELILPMIENFPELLSKHPNRLKIFFDLIVQNMLEIEDEITDSWKNPPDGFNDDVEEEDDQKPIKFGIEIVNTLFTVIEPKQMIDFLSGVLKPMFENQNWKPRHVAIMILSQIGEYIEDDINYLKSILTAIEINAKDSNPKVRYACCHLLGQFADDIPIKFQNNFHNEYFAIAIPLLQDPVPRVVAHALASMMNFLENATKLQILPVFDKLFTLISNWMVHGSVFVRESAFSAMSALFEAVPEQMEPHIDNLMNYCFQIFKITKIPTYKYLKGNVIEFSTIICKSTNKQKFEKYINQLIEEMVNLIKTDIVLEGNDPQKSYLLSGFQRLGLVVPEHLVPRLPEIMNCLFVVSKSVLDHQNESYKAKSSMSQESELALQLMSTFIDQMPNEMLKFESQLVELMNLMIDKSGDKEVELSALDVLAMVTKLYKKNPTQKNNQMIRTVVDKMWNFIDLEEDPEILSDSVFTLEKVFKHCGKVFTSEELLEFYNKIKKEIASSLERKTKFEEEIDEEDEKEDIKNAVEETEELEQQLQLELANLIGFMFKSHGEVALPLFNIVHEQLLIPAWQMNTPGSLRFALFLIDDSLEHLGKLLPPNIILDFFQKLQVGAQRPEVVLRQSAIFGIGVVSQIMGESFEPYLNQILELINKTMAIKIPDDNTYETKEYKGCLDNCGSALGKILKVMWNKLDPAARDNLLNKWLHSLPLLEDAKENIINIGMLLQILEAKPDIILGYKPENMKKILEIFSACYRQRKLSNEEIDGKIKATVTGFLTNEEIKKFLMALNLDEVTKQFLNEIHAGN